MTLLFLGGYSGDDEMKDQDPESQDCAGTCGRHDLNGIGSNLLSVL